MDLKPKGRKEFSRVIYGNVNDAMLKLRDYVVVRSDTVSVCGLTAGMLYLVYSSSMPQSASKGLFVHICFVIKKPVKILCILVLFMSPVMVCTYL